MPVDAWPFGLLGGGLLALGFLGLGLKVHRLERDRDADRDWYDRQFNGVYGLLNAAPPAPGPARNAGPYRGDEGVPVWKALANPLAPLDTTEGGDDHVRN